MVCRLLHYRLPCRRNEIFRRASDGWKIGETISLTVSISYPLYGYIVQPLSASWYYVAIRIPLLSVLYSAIQTLKWMLSSNSVVFMPPPTDAQYLHYSSTCFCFLPLGTFRRIHGSLMCTKSRGKVIFAYQSSN